MKAINITVDDLLRVISQEAYKTAEEYIKEDNTLIIQIKKIQLYIRQWVSVIQNL